MRQIYGLDYDYVQQQGYYLIFSKEGGLYSTDLSKLQVKMLQVNSIPKLVPIEIEERDLNVKFRFQISSKRLLSDLLKGQRLRLEEYYMLLFKVVSILEDSKNYMLLEDHYIIHEDFIYLGRDVNDVQLVYLPLKHLPKKSTALDDVKSLALTLIGAVEELKGDGLQDLMNAFKDTQLTLSEVKKVLIKLMDASVSTSTVDMGGSKSERSSSKSTEFQIDQPSQLNKLSYSSQQNQQNQQNQQIQKNQSNPHNKSSSVSKQTISAKESNSQAVSLDPLSSREKTYLFLAGFILIAGIWRVYLEFKSEGMLYFSFGLTIVVVTGVYVYLKIWRPDSRDLNSKPSSGRQSSVNLNSNSSIGRQVNLSREEVAVAVSSMDIEPVGQVFRSVREENLANHTTLLTKKDKTVLLKEKFVLADPDQNIDIVPIVEVEKRGQKESVKLLGNSFIIGRNPEFANYVDDSAGVSRAHVEILLNGQEVQVKDLGSSNGTLLNSEQLVPSKLYPLTDGDVLEIAKTTYTYKLENTISYSRTKQQQYQSKSIK